MKNQYFGDDRDLFKYDLIYQIMKADIVDYLVFIPMLTEPDGTKQGEKRHRKKAGVRNIGMVKFLDDCIRDERRNIKELKEFFIKETMSMTIYGENEYLTCQNRKEYFSKICNALRPKSLIFVDPDIGLQPQISEPSEKHILYSEVEDLYNRMDRQSFLMLFQFIQRKKREKYFAEASKKLNEQVGNSPIYISDNQIVFFFLTKDEAIREAVDKVVSDYAKSYKLKFDA